MHGSRPNTPGFENKTPLWRACNGNRLEIVHWFILQGTPSKATIGSWFNRLNLQNRRALYHYAKVSRDVTYERFLTFVCFAKYGNIHALDSDLVLKRISDFVQGIEKGRSLWYCILREGKLHVEIWRKELRVEIYKDGKRLNNTSKQ